MAPIRDIIQIYGSEIDFLPATQFGDIPVGFCSLLQKSQMVFWTI